MTDLPAPTLIDAPTGGAGNSERVLTRVLDLAREQLGMDIAWVSEFVDGDQRLRAVGGDTDRFGVHSGLRASYEGSYCARVVDGRLPAVIPDAKADDRTSDLEVTEQLGIGAYVGAPLTLADGSVHGMLCCISRNADPALDDKDARFLAVLAQAAAEELDREKARDADRALRESRLQTAIRGESMTMAFQPIVDLNSMQIIGAEALARFSVEPRNPAAWFDDATELGLAEDLELTAIRLALEALDALPGDVYLSVNASPAVIVSSAFAELLAGPAASRLQVEVTEQTEVVDYDSVVAALDLARSRGARIAIDDAGEGYAGLQRILRLNPDVIKLDIALTRDIDSDPIRQALARSLVDFAGHANAKIIAEGVETQAELDMLLWLGIGAAQGYFLGRPLPLPLNKPTVTPTPRRFATRDDATLTEVADASANAASLEELIRPLLEAVVARTGLESSYLAFKNGDRNSLDIQFVFNASTLDIPEPLTLEWTDSLCNRSHEQGLLWTADVAADLPGSPTVEELDLRTFLSVPIGIGTPKRTVGTLCAVSRDSRYLTAADIAEVQSLAGLVAEQVASDPEAVALD